MANKKPVSKKANHNYEAIVFEKLKRYIASIPERLKRFAAQIIRPFIEMALRLQAWRNADKNAIR